MEENMLIKIYPNELLDILIQAGIQDQEAKSLVFDILMMKMLPETKNQVRKPIVRPPDVVQPTKQVQHQQYDNSDDDGEEYDQPTRPVTQVRRSVSGQNMNFSNFGQDFKGLKK